MDVAQERKIIRVGSAGFCWGVKRAVDMAEELSESGTRPVYTDGPLIHNKQMMDKLEASNIKEVGDYQSKSTIQVDQNDKDAVMLVRAHGISTERRKYLKSIGLRLKDATCPDVGIIAGKLKLHAKKGFFSVIFGNPDHPEVIGLLSYTAGRGYVVQTKRDIDQLPDLGELICMVSQTTMFVDDYNILAAYLKARFPSTIVQDTICGATKERQTDILRLVKNDIEAVVVIGGQHSANTVKLVSLVERYGRPAFHVEKPADLDKEALREYKKIGVTAGASTPNFIIDSVCEALSKL